MSDQEVNYSIDELAKAVGVSARTVRHWAWRGVFDPPQIYSGVGYYSEHHRAQAIEIVRLRREGLLLDEIKAHFAQVAAARAEEARALAAMVPLATPPSIRDAAATQDTLRAYPAEQWERVVLLPGLELHVNVAGGAILSRVAKEIYAQFGPAPRVT